LEGEKGPQPKKNGDVLASFYCQITAETKPGPLGTRGWQDLSWVEDKGKKKERWKNDREEARGWTCLTEKFITKEGNELSWNFWEKKKKTEKEKRRCEKKKIWDRK